RLFRGAVFEIPGTPGSRAGVRVRRRQRRAAEHGEGQSSDGHHAGGGNGAGKRGAHVRRPLCEGSPHSALPREQVASEERVSVPFIAAAESRAGTCRRLSKSRAGGWVHTS